MGSWAGTPEYAWLKSESAKIATNHNWQMVIEVVRGAGQGKSRHLGHTWNLDNLFPSTLGADVSLDDISFTPGCNPVDPMTTPQPPPPSSTTEQSQCDQHQFRCHGDGRCIPEVCNMHNRKEGRRSSSVINQFSTIQLQVCDFFEQCEDGSDESSCPRLFRFEEDMQGWKEQVPDILDWIRAKGVCEGGVIIAALAVLPSRFSPSANDPESGTDVNGPYGSVAEHFLFLHPEKSEDDFGGADARVASPAYRNSDTGCTWNFWFYSNGDTG